MSTYRQKSSSFAAARVARRAVIFLFTYICFFAPITACATPDERLGKIGSASGVVAHEALSGADDIYCNRRIGLFLGDDESLSTKKSGAPHLMTNELDQAIEIVEKCGGRIAVGRVTERFPDAFVSARFAARNRVSLPPPDTIGTAFERQHATEVYNAARQQYVADSTRTKREEDSGRATFRAKASELISEEARAPRSAICDLIARAVLFVESAPNENEDRYIVLATDQFENVNPAACEKVSTSAKLLLVGSVERRLSLHGIAIRQFENVRDALDYVLSDHANRGS